MCFNAHDTYTPPVVSSIHHQRHIAMTVPFRHDEEYMDKYMIVEWKHANRPSKTNIIRKHI